MIRGRARATGRRPVARPTAPLVLWHYTTGRHFERIAAEGLLKPTAANIERGERPALWFSTADPWEPTAAKGLLLPDGTTRSLSMEEHVRYGAGLVRIGVDPIVAPHDWQAFLRLSGISAEMAQGLVASARMDGADPADWYVTFRPVPRACWTVVEVWHRGAWVRAWPEGAVA